MRKSDTKNAKKHGMHSTTPEEIGRRLHDASFMWSKPDAVRFPKHQSPEAFAFQVAQAALDLWPMDVKITDLDIAVITGEARDTALTVHLNELANF